MRKLYTTSHLFAHPDDNDNGTIPMSEHSLLAHIERHPDAKQNKAKSVEMMEWDGVRSPTMRTPNVFF